jgi:hypothetical protein
VCGRAERLVAHMKQLGVHEDPGLDRVEKVRLAERKALRNVRRPEHLATVNWLPEHGGPSRLENSLNG